MAEPSWPSAEELARRFHTTYEALAPQFDYETRSRTAWEDVPERNRALMVTTCALLLAWLRDHFDPEVTVAEQWTAEDPEPWQPASSGEQSDRTDWRREAELLDRTLTQAARRFIEVVTEREEARSELARVRAQVAAEMADTLDNKILRIREMAEATRALADACRNAFADQPMPEAWRDLFARVDEAYAAVPSGTPGNPADHPESRWQYVEPTDA